MASRGRINSKKKSTARKARKETLDFLAQVQGFIEKRDELNNLANAVLPLGLANHYCNFPPEKKELKQDRDSAESIERIKLDPKLAKELMDRIRSDAVLAKKKLDDLGKRIVLAALGVDPLKELFREKATKERIAEGKGDKVQLYFNLGPLKSGERCDEKTKNEYDGDPCGLLDVARASIVVTSEEELDAVLKYIFDNFTSDNDDCQLERFKNRYLHPTFNGYRDGLFNLRVKLPDGRYHIVELQIHLLDIIKFKAATHKYYEFFRAYFAGNLDVVGERMELLESIVQTGGESIDVIVSNALDDGEKDRLLAIKDLLDKMSELEMLQTVEKKLVDLARNAHGGNSAEFATAVNNLAGTLRNQGKLEEAEPLYRQALAIDEKVYGKDHPDVAMDLNNLALLLEEQGKYSEAEPLYRQCLAIDEKVYGEMHPEVAFDLNNLASLLKSQGKDDEAKQCTERAQRINEK